jgi:regulator of protease activity HflC (stomatin/prohibitin superfamily)
MGKALRVGLVLSGAVLSALLTSWVAGHAFAMMNRPSDFWVLVGLDILLILSFVWFLLIWRAGSALIRRWRTRVGGKRRNPARPALLLLAAAGLSGAAGCARVPPGYVGIKVNMAGDDRGVNDIPLRTGWVFYNVITQKVFTYPTFVQTAIWTRSVDEGSPTNEEVTFNTREGLIMTGDISFSYSLIEPKVPRFYVKFRSDDLNRFTHGYLRNVARDVFNETGSRYSIEEVYGPKKAEFLRDVRTRIQDEMKDMGIVLEQFGFIGAPRPPETVIEALNAKVAATQNAMRAENELRQAEAEAKKAIAKARGEAESNRILARSITPQLVQWRQLQITEQAVVRWNGARPLVEGQGNGFLLQIPLPKQ